ncbi:AAA family ATPase [Streptomyces sp. NPDC005438]|uniref:AAA family ATPase n=1 Tax=Streptomyces sp. NPDC005438 TaxID=3156880 RepID=UPI0033A233B0
MLVWINGPFGGGKTVTAHELRRRLPGSVICDPEHLGFGMHRMLPRALRGDFQDLPAWRHGVVETLDLAARHHPGTVIVPMTVVEPTYFRETVGALRERGHVVRHFALLARPGTVRRRLREREVVHLARRATGQVGESFAHRRLDHCLESLAGEEFAEHLWTDRLPVPRVAERIASRAGLTLLPNRDGPVAERLRRAWVGVRHIRFD